MCPKLRRNLISESSLVQLGYKVVMESDKVVISKNNIFFIRKGFVNDGVYKLNLIIEDNKSSSRVLNIESCDVWYARLGHVNL